MKGLNVTNYTTMDYITILMRDYLFFCLYKDTKIDRYKDIKITPYLLLLYKYAYIYMFEKKTGSDQPDSNQ